MLAWYIVKHKFDLVNLSVLFIVILFTYVIVSTLRIVKKLLIDLKPINFFGLSKVEMFIYLNLSIMLDISSLIIICPSLLLIYLMSGFGLISFVTTFIIIILYLFLLNSIVINIYLLWKILFRNRSTLVALIPILIIIFQVMYRVFGEKSFEYFPVSNYLGVAVNSIWKSDWSEWSIMCVILIIILSVVYSANYLLLNNEKVYK
ncbi:MAG: hypothetical protein AB1432_10595 [Bacteroidota bacterium]